MSIIVDKKPVVRFVYSFPYEDTLLRLKNEKLTREHASSVIKKAETSQKVWNKYEKQILRLFEEIYKIEIPEKFIKVYISLVSPTSLSDPMTISHIRRMNLERSAKEKKSFLHSIIHELAHYFSYTRPRDSFFRNLFSKIKEQDKLGSLGANLHYLIQAVELGIIGEVFGYKYANELRESKIERTLIKNKEDEYGVSAKALKEDNIPMDKTCLEYIDKNILKSDH